jgi:hypothetical protein
MHSHPEAAVVVLKGGRVPYSFLDGMQKVIELKIGDAIRPFVTHLDEAIDPLTVFWWKSSTKSACTRGMRAVGLK